MAYYTIAVLKKRCYIFAHASRKKSVSTLKLVIQICTVRAFVFCYQKYDIQLEALPHKSVANINRTN